MDEDGDFGRVGVGIGDGDCATSWGGRFGKLVGVGDGSGAPSFGAAFLAGFARVGGVGTLICRAGGGAGGLARVGFVGLASGAGGGFLTLVFILGEPVIFPAEAVKKFFEEAAGVDVFRGAHAGDEAVDVAFAASRKFVGGFESLAARTATRDDEAGIDHSPDEGYTFVDGLAVLLFWVESEVKFTFEEFLDGVDVAEELFALLGGDDNEEVVDVTTVMFVAEVESDIAVELVEENVGEELASEIANDDAAAFGLIEEAFADGELAPVGARAADNDVFHGIIVNDLVPEKFDDLIELVAVASMTADAVLVIIFFVIKRNMGSSVGVIFELAVETPTNTFVKFVMVETHKITLDVEFDDEGGASVIFGGTADVGGEALLAEESAFADTARIGVDEEAAVPPVGANVVEKVMDDAIAERGGDDFADDGIVDDEGDAATGFVAALNNAVAEENQVFHIVELKAVFVDSLALAFAGAIISVPKFAKEKIFETSVMKSGEFDVGIVVWAVEVGRTIRVLVKH